jgi:hypothetical protein
VMVEGVNLEDVNKYATQLANDVKKSITS